MESLPARLVVANQIIESLHEIRLLIEDAHLHGMALQILANHISQYAGDLSAIEREALRLEISLVVDMIS